MGKIRATFHLKDGSEHQLEHTKLLINGMELNGVECSYAPHDKLVDSDLSVFWSWKSPKLIGKMLRGETNVLCMERGYLPDRMKWCSLAVNGFNGQAKYVPATDNGEKFSKYFSHMVAPWKNSDDGYVLLIGQVPNDPSLHGMDIDKWAEKTAKEINLMGYSVVYRPHPWVRSKYNHDLNNMFVPRNAILSNSSLKNDLEGAVFCVCYNSNTAVESVLYGCPTVVYHDGSVAWPVCSHSLEEPVVTPDRTDWLHNLSWRQFSHEELSDGTAWKHVRYSLPMRFWS